VTLEDTETDDEDPVADEVTIRQMNVSELDKDPDRGPTAVINRSRAEPLEVDREAEADQEIHTKGYDVLTQVDEPVNLSGERSLIGQATGVDRERQIAKLVDIQVPEDQRNQPGTVRMTIKRSKLGETDPGNATIAHKTGQGWQLLDTEIVRSTEQTLTLEARTPSFSPFAVFVETDVSYTWTLPDGSTFEGKEVRSQFDEPGVYNVSLTVTDSLGRSDSTDYQVLVNDGGKDK
ncbi:MAG: PKD domain-containing protein, partial [Halobacteriales archaeon]